MASGALERPKDRCEDSLRGEVDGEVCRTPKISESVCKDSLSVGTDEEVTSNTELAVSEGAGTEVIGNEMSCQRGPDNVEWQETLATSERGLSPSCMEAVHPFAVLVVHITDFGTRRHPARAAVSRSTKLVSTAPW